MRNARSELLIWVFIFVALSLQAAHGEADLKELVREAKHHKLTVNSSPTRRFKLVRIASKQFSLQANSEGIVIAAGGSNQLANALATVQVIREDLQCNLPVEVLYFGKEEADPTFIAALEAIQDVKTRDAESLAKRDKNVSWCDSPGYLKKIFAIYYSSFAKFLYLDADNTPLRNPSELFELAEFKAWGNIFWPDYMGPGRYESAKPEIYEAFKIRPPWESQWNWKCTESGQFLFDRQMHADVMEWIFFLNKAHETTYEYLYGDKDTFELAFNLAGKGGSFYRIGYGPRPSFRPVAEDSHFAHTGMLQTDSEGDPLFFHQVAGGKFYLEQAGLAVPALTSLGMSEAALNAMAWDSELGTLRLSIEHAVRPYDVKCRHLDGATASLFNRMNKTRWDTCGTMASGDGDPLPLLPLNTFPNYVLDTINSLLSRFQLIQRQRHADNSASLYTS